MAHHSIDHDRPFTLRILAALVATGVYYGLVLGLSIRVFLTVLRAGWTYWVTVPVGGAAGLALAGWCSLTWLWIRLREEPEFLEITPQQFPRFHTLVRETARHVGVAMPGGLYVSQRPNGFSLFWGILGLNVQWTGLGIGAPLVPVLSEVELKGLIAHELGHMQSLRARSGDGWYMWAMYNYWSCSDTLARSTTWMKILCPQIWYAFVMTHLTWRVACQEELAADACAVRAVRPRDHGSALEGIAVAQEMFREFIATEVSGLLDLGVRPRNVFEGFRRHVAGLTESDRDCLLARYHERDLTRDFAHGLEESGTASSAAPEYGIMPADRWDPHPRLADRIEHLHALPAAGATYVSAGVTPIDGLDLNVERQLTQRLLVPLLAKRPGVRWRTPEWESLDDQFDRGATKSAPRRAAAAPPHTSRRRPAVAVVEDITWE